MLLKLQSTQDLINAQLQQNNRAVMNMLNTKYFIGQGEDGSLGYQKNEQAYGNAWFVDSLTVVSSKEEAIEVLSTLKSKKHAIVETAFDETQLNASAASIELVNYHPERLVYKAKNNSNSKQLALFSEINYRQKDGDGWHATIDGNEVPILTANFLLRALEVPAGEHEIVFTFKTTNFQNRATISKGFSLLLILSGLAPIILQFLRKRNEA